MGLLSQSGATTPWSPFMGDARGWGVLTRAPDGLCPCHSSPAAQEEVAVNRLDPAGVPCSTVGGTGRKPLSPLRPR